MSRAESSLLEFDAVGFRYPVGDFDAGQDAGRDGPWVLDDVNFEVDQGERIVILGANGCGKSTLLKLADGLLFAAPGTVRYRGRELDRAGLSEKSWRREFRSEVGLVFQHPEAMLFNPTVREEIGYGPQRLGKPQANELALQWAHRMGLAGKLDRAPFTLSGGEKQRLALACVLACEPRLLLLDEPTANLDPRAIGWLIDYLSETPELAVMTTTQNLALAGEMGQRALVLSETGRVLFDGALSTALSDESLLVEANLAHRHVHQHEAGQLHRHLHSHEDWS